VYGLVIDIEFDFNIEILVWSFCSDFRPNLARGPAPTGQVLEMVSDALGINSYDQVVGPFVTVMIIRTEKLNFSSLLL
jgi:hypothetical protein